MEALIEKLNLALSAEEVETVALYINTSIEGTTMIAGHGKPWSSKMPHLKEIAVKFLVDLAKNITLEESSAIAAHNQETSVLPVSYPRG